MALFIVLFAVSGLIHERRQRADGGQAVATPDVMEPDCCGIQERMLEEEEATDCQAWAQVSFRQKIKRYRANPARWARCLCDGEACELDRLYLTGNLSGKLEPGSAEKKLW